MSEIDNLAQLIRQVDGDHTMGAGELAEHIIEGGYRNPEPQIIRTLDELFSLDPEAVCVRERFGETYTARVLHMHPDHALPAVVIATGEHVRAARKALEKEQEQDND